ncbi:MAG: hypothetical protein ABIH41_01280 [Nanoarchaeota archaeon]
MALPQEDFGPCSTCAVRSTVRLSYNARSFCDACFLRMIFRRIAKDIPSGSGPIRVRDDGSAVSRVLVLSLRRMLGTKRQVEVVESDGKDVCLPLCLEDGLDASLCEFIGTADGCREGMLVFASVTHEDAAHLGRIVGVDCRQGLARRRSSHSPLLSAILGAHPEVRFSMRRSFQFLQA